MNKRYLAVVLISMTLLFVSVQAFDYFMFNEFPRYEDGEWIIGGRSEPTVLRLSPASICGDGEDVTGTNTHDCSQYVVTGKPSCNAAPCCQVHIIGPVENWECLVRLCSHADITNPDMCSGCNGCTGNWNIDDDRSTTPWNITVTGNLLLESGGEIIIQSGRTITVEGCAKIRDTDALKISGTLKVGGSC